MEIKAYTREELEQLQSSTDYDRLEAMTDEEARAAAESDPDNQPLTDAQLSKMRPTSEVLPWLVNKENRGRPVKEKPKVSVTIRLNQEIVEYFKSGGQGWQTRLNAALHDYMEQHPNKAA